MSLPALPRFLPVSDIAQQQEYNTVGSDSAPLGEPIYLRQHAPGVLSAPRCRYPGDHAGSRVGVQFYLSGLGASGAGDPLADSLSECLAFGATVALTNGKKCR